MSKKRSRSSLEKKLDTAFSRYVRLRDSDDDGYGNCITCGANRHYTEADCGHFITRACRSTRWDEQNAHLQCKRCNGFLSGRQFEHGRAIDEKYGEGTAEAVLHKSKHIRKFTGDELKAMCQHFERLARELAESKGLA